MKYKLHLFIAAALFCVTTAFAGYITVINGSGTPEGVIAAEVGQIYTDTATGNTWLKTTGVAKTGWKSFNIGPLGNSVTGTITLTSGSGTLTNSAITTNSYAVLTAQGATAPNSAYTFTPSAGTAAITGGNNTTTARYVLFNP